MPLVLLAVERAAAGAGRRAGSAADLLAAAVAGRDAGADRAWRSRRCAGGARGERPPLAVLAVPARRGAAGGVLRRARADRRRVGAGRARSTRPASQATWSWPWWAIVLTLRRSPCPPRSRTACRRPAGRSSPCACGRSRRWRSTCAPVGTFPYHAFQGLAIPLVDARGPGRRVASGRGRGRRSSSACLALMIAAGHRAQVQRRGELRSARPATRTSCSRASSARSTRSSATRGRAACSRRPTAATCSRTGPGARCTSARCRGRRTGTRACARRARCSRAT